MTQFYSDPERENIDTALPDCEVFYWDRAKEWYGGAPLENGWYYWFCFPGCLPDSEPIGPYDTEAAAIAAARED